MENQRIRISKTMLKKALLSLLKDKPLNQITIYELCTTAQINRTTFYKYYGNQTDLLEEIKHEFLSNIDIKLSEKQQHHEDGLPLALEYLYENRETFNILVNVMPLQHFVDGLFELPSIQNIFQILFKEIHTTDIKEKYLQKFVSNGILAVLCSWLQSDHPESVSEIQEILASYRSALFRIN